MKKKPLPPRVLGGLDKLFIGIMLAIFAGIVVHAPLTVWLGTVLPGLDLQIKAWKEILMGVGAVIAATIVIRQKRWDILKSPWLFLAGVYILWHVLLIPLFFTNLTATAAGLLIDLRYVVFFGLMVVLVQLYPQLRRLFLWVFAVGLALVAVFALLQVFVLPPDFLTAIGYGDETISPYLTVDENPDYVRINGTLRGPNPLGAFAVIGLAAAAAIWLRGQVRPKGWWLALAGVVTTGLFVALWTSYSRSALVAAVVALGLVFLLTVGRQLHRWVWITLFVVAFAITGGVYAARDTSFVSNVILHENEGTGATVSSNDGHIESLIDGTDRLVRQPLGAGIGSTGSASLFTSQPVIIENQYLFIAHEVGWIGLALFLLLFGRVLLVAWRRRSDWLALAVLSSGLGLALIGLLLPVWVDDTVSIIWWGLAALAVGGRDERAIHKTPKRTA
ncbi:hypothetical protein CL689_04175 [Candidatus Saccharibacteria bacterium]|nr:hypothetical protein [Candidatus Saccharibacteria bacterium]MBQ69241.1 hypothetical protein [Candidatus Saccharibacteria bacterium]